MTSIEFFQTILHNFQELLLILLLYISIIFLLLCFVCSECTISNYSEDFNYKLAFVCVIYSSLRFLCFFSFVLICHTAMLLCFRYRSPALPRFSSSWIINGWSPTCRKVSWFPVRKGDQGSNRTLYKCSSILK